MPPARPPGHHQAARGGLRACIHRPSPASHGTPYAQCGVANKAYVVESTCSNSARVDVLIASCHFFLYGSSGY